MEKPNYVWDADTLLVLKKQAISNHAGKGPVIFYDHARNLMPDIVDEILHLRAENERLRDGK